jgi:hypothetical protein
MIRTVFTIAAFAVVGHAAAPGALLDEAAKAAEREISALSSVACTETVIETKFNQKDKTEERRRQIFDYLILIDADGGDLAVTESRVEQGGVRKAEAKPLLASTGFATLMLILHPYYQNSFEFTDLGTMEENGRHWRRLGFEFVPGRRSPSLLRSGAREYPLAWSGEVHIDEATGRVGLVHASLGSQLEEIGLDSLDATVRYGPVAGQASQEWLPEEAVVDLKTRHQHWRNVHTFTGYKRFEVTTTEKRETKQP